MSGCTGGTGVGNMAIGPSPPHPGIENVASIPATWHPSHLRSKSANWLTADIHRHPHQLSWSEVKWSCSVVSNSLWPHELGPTRILCPWDFPGKNTGVGFHFLLHGIFPTQGSNLSFPHCRQMLYHLSHQFAESDTTEQLTLWLSAFLRDNCLKYDQQSRVTRYLKEVCIKEKERLRQSKVTL